MQAGNCNDHIPLVSVVCTKYIWQKLLHTTFAYFFWDEVLFLRWFVIELNGGDQYNKNKYLSVDGGKMQGISGMLLIINLHSKKQPSSYWQDHRIKKIFKSGLSQNYMVNMNMKWFINQKSTRLALEMVLQ